MWTPASLSPDIWLDGGVSGSFTLSGAQVSTWDDQSGHNRNASNATSATQPFKATRTDGRGGILTDASGRYMDVINASTLTAGIQSLSLFAVFATSYAPSTNGLIAVFAGGTNKARAGLYCRPDGCMIIGRRLDDDVSTYCSVTGPTRGIFSGEWSYGSRTQWAGLNGTQASSPLPSSGATSATNSTAVQLGKFLTGNLAAGALNELLVIRSILSTTDRARLLGFLAAKWGVLDLIAAGTFAAIGGNVTKASGGAAEKVLVTDVDSGIVLATTTPDEAGDWTAEVPPGDCYVTYLAAGCKPITHGPFTVNPPA